MGEDPTRGPRRREDRGDWQRTPDRSGWSWSTHPIALILIVIVGMTVAWAIREAIVVWQVRTALEQFTHSSQEAIRRAQVDAQRAQRELAVRELQRQAELQQKEAAKQQVIAQRQQLEAQLKMDVAAAAARKEKAWAKFYRRPAICLESATVQCANEFIRAKRQFEDKYAKGEL